MIGVTWHDPQESWFEGWKKRESEETKAAIAAKKGGTEYEFKAAIWGRIKDHLASIFRGKCAYCESKLLHITPGDVEHYRPKSKVTDCPGHPGYYWLAYDTSNLLLSCELCNRGGGKMNQFPVIDNVWSRSPDDGVQEQPLLINPYVDEPKEHFAFAPPVGNVSVGTIRGTTERGDRTAEVCQLRRTELNDRRAAAQDATLAKLYIAVVRGTQGQVRAELEAGTQDYSAACLSAAQA